MIGRNLGRVSECKIIKAYTLLVTHKPYWTPVGCIRKPHEKNFAGTYDPNHGAVTTRDHLELELENCEEMAVQRFFVREQNIVITLSPKLSW